MASASPIKTYRLTEHAKLEMARRQISDAEVSQVLTAPEQSEAVNSERVVYQSRVIWGQIPRPYLLRVVVDTDREPPEVVTVYRTSKISKYWRAER